MSKSMFRIATRQTCLANRKAFSTSPSKIPLSVVADLRRKTQVSINKAREALGHSNGDINGALTWLQKDMMTTGPSKAAKVASRETKEGLVSVSVLSQGAGPTTAGGIRAAMIELNCETDFVSRNQLFTKLAMDIAHTAAFISEAKTGDTSFLPVPLEVLKDAPLLSHSDPGSSPDGTVSDAIRDTIVKVGENVTLGRATAIVEEAPFTPTPSYNILRVGSYVHGALHHLSCGQVSTLALVNLRSQQLSQLLQQENFHKELATLERSIARQITGFDTLSIRPAPQNEAQEQALYKQPFITAGEFNGLPVEEALQSWSINRGLAVNDQGGIEVLSFLKWRVGEIDRSLRPC